MTAPLLLAYERPDGDIRIRLTLYGDVEVAVGEPRRGLRGIYIAVSTIVIPRNRWPWPVEDSPRKKIHLGGCEVEVEVCAACHTRIMAAVDEAEEMRMRYEDDATRDGGA